MINETKAHDSYGDFESSTCCFSTHNCDKQTLSRQILCTKFVNTLLEICPQKKKLKHLIILLLPKSSLMNMYVVFVLKQKKIKNSGGYKSSSRIGRVGEIHYPLEAQERRDQESEQGDQSGFRNGT
jgi:hypothetical protein